MVNTIHIVERFTVPWSGSALTAIGLHRRLNRDARVCLWSEGNVATEYKGHPIVAISAGMAPAGGTLILVGGYFEPGEWLEVGTFQRVIVVLTLVEFPPFFRLLSRTRCAGLPDPEIVYPSAMLRDMVSIPGHVDYPPIDIRAFSPRRYESEWPFTVGRHSRDLEIKHHEDDPSLYRMLALQGHRVRIMGGTCLEPYLGIDRDGVDLLPAGAEPAPEFLSGLDCFFYRTFPTCTESFGCVVMEAMACGLPVVVESRHGYAEHLRHGENALMADTQEEAWDQLQALAVSADYRRRIGMAARQTAEQLYSAENEDVQRDWYLAPLTGTEVSLGMLW